MFFILFHIFISPFSNGMCHAIELIAVPYALQMACKYIFCIFYSWLCAYLSTSIALLHGIFLIIGRNYAMQVAAGTKYPVYVDSHVTHWTIMWCMPARSPFHLKFMDGMKFRLCAKICTKIITNYSDKSLLKSHTGILLYIVWMMKPFRRMGFAETIRRYVEYFHAMHAYYNTPYYSDGMHFIFTLASVLPALLIFIIT